MNTSTSDAPEDELAGEPLGEPAVERSDGLADQSPDELVVERLDDPLDAVRSSGSTVVPRTGPYWVSASVMPARIVCLPPCQLVSAARSCGSSPA
ncbi:hypothetical protein GCM10009804_12970 [Kribbella hippodromi]|uniref:Uncharacterized protein n=1 Tax=Kribbella hippodromi TaxID=434347 RepID=A0ABP4N834_9ACTN